MRLDARLPLTGRRWSTFGLVALVSCLMSFGTSEAVAKATTSTSLTQAQKLSKALKACKKQPKAKRAGCVKGAKKKYAPHHALTPLPSTAVTPPPGHVAPAPITLEEIQRLICLSHCERGVPIENLTILARGVPRLGTGLTERAGGDGVLATTWIFPLLLEFDEPVQGAGHYEGTVWVPERKIHHYKEKVNAQFDEFGTWRLSLQSVTMTCVPAELGCGFSVGGGA